MLIVVAVSFYPNIVISTTDPAYNLTVHNASASSQSPVNLLTVAAIGIPWIATYTTLFFRIFKGKVE